jgi:hypothetical protein
MENLNGRKLVEAGDLCERRNGTVSYFSCMIFSSIVTNFEMPEVYIMWQAEELISTGIGV